MTNKELVDELTTTTKLLTKLLNGGKGSGNFGHSGRKGKRGGSSKVKIAKTNATAITFDRSSPLQYTEHDNFYGSFAEVYKDGFIPEAENSYNGKPILSKKTYIHSKSTLVEELKPEITDRQRVEEVKSDFINNKKYSAILMVEDGNRFKIADGNHTAQAMKELAKTEADFYIPVILANQKNLKNWEDKFPSKTGDTEAYNTKKDYETIIRSSK